MTYETPFLLIVEISAGYSSHSIFKNLEDASEGKKVSFKNEQRPICIYDLNTKEFVWKNEEFPAYGETISNQIIQSYEASN